MNKALRRIKLNAYYKQATNFALLGLLSRLKSDKSTADKEEEVNAAHLMLNELRVAKTKGDAKYKKVSDQIKIASFMDAIEYLEYVVENFGDIEFDMDTWNKVKDIWSNKFSRNPLHTHTPKHEITYEDPSQPSFRTKEYTEAPVSSSSRLPGVMPVTDKSTTDRLKASTDAGDIGSLYVSMSPFGLIVDGENLADEISNFNNYVNKYKSGTDKDAETIKLFFSSEEGQNVGIAMLAFIPWIGDWWNAAKRNRMIRKMERKIEENRNQFLVKEDKDGGFIWRRVDDELGIKMDYDYNPSTNQYLMNQHGDEVDVLWKKWHQLSPEQKNTLAELSEGSMDTLQEYVRKTMLVKEPERVSKIDPKEFYERKPPLMDMWKHHEKSKEHKQLLDDLQNPLYSDRGSIELGEAHLRGSSPRSIHRDWGSRYSQPRAYEYGNDLTDIEFKIKINQEIVDKAAISMGSGDLHKETKRVLSLLRSSKYSEAKKETYKLLSKLKKLKKDKYFKEYHYRDMEDIEEKLGDNLALFKERSALRLEADLAKRTLRDLSRIQVDKKEAEELLSILYSQNKDETFGRIHTSELLRDFTLGKDGALPNLVAMKSKEVGFTMIDLKKTTVTPTGFNVKYQDTAVPITSLTPEEYLRFRVLRHTGQADRTDSAAKILTSRQLNTLESPEKFEELYEVSIEEYFAYLPVYKAKYPGADLSPDSVCNEINKIKAKEAKGKILSNWGLLLEESKLGVTEAGIDAAVRDMQRNYDLKWVEPKDLSEMSDVDRLKYKHDLFMKNLEFAPKEYWQAKKYTGDPDLEKVDLLDIDDLIEYEEPIDQKSKRKKSLRRLHQRSKK